ncbi:glutaredoxin [candidate division WOR-3 bacterium]|uniref:Glutaredoxin n=1 Tax=candidate division WOR-3 bacterium TaxID=2052148 RepID=A0A9D5QDV2_UNCW3|nr:glutaredoxin [candidate division WOR-3 bacterium]MBD3365426.1 glutaredoxin [candidate division WOR-3 bacterium]
MGMLKEEDKEYITEQFSEKLTSKVKVLLFSQKLECEYCLPTEEILKELTGLSDKLTLDVRNLQIDSEDAKGYGVDKVPAIILLGEDDKDYGIRFFGIPSGYEFSSLLADIIDVSNGESDLPSDLVAKIASIDKPVDIKVFVTPTCPYCPNAVRTAHKIALANPGKIKAEMIESTEFPHLANKYAVYGVPKTIINEEVQFEGAMPDQAVVEQVMTAIEKSD